SFYLEAALNTLELFKRTGNNIDRDSVVRSHSRRCGCVPDIVFSGERKLTLRPGAAVLQDRPSRVVRFQLQICNPPRGFIRGPVPLHRTKGPRNRAFDAVTVVKGDNASAARD